MKIVVSTYSDNEKYVDVCVRVLDELWGDHPPIVVFSDKGAFNYASRALGTSRAWAPLMFECLNESLRTAMISPDENVVLLLEDHVPHAPVDGSLIAGLDRFLRDNGDSYLNLSGHGSGRIVGSVDTCPVHLFELHEFYSSLHPAIWSVAHLRRTLDAAIAHGVNSPWQFERIELPGVVHFTTAANVWPSPGGGFLSHGLVNRPALRTMKTGALVALRRRLLLRLALELPKRLSRRALGLVKRPASARSNSATERAAPGR